MANNWFYPNDAFIFDTYTEIQQGFIERIIQKGTDNAIQWLKTVKNEQECSKPRKLRFSWKKFADLYVFEISEYGDFSSAIRFNTAKNFLELDNFKVGQKYFWRVNGGDIHWFQTKDNLFRFINLDGALNVRDLGGNCIKQGILYRGTEFDEFYHLSQKGQEIFIEELKIKTQLDLRGENIQHRADSPFGEKVNLIQIRYRPYAEIFEVEHRENICKIMDVLSDEKNYPVYIHCVGGADRTGMIAIYLRALAGESDEEIFTDYELTGLSNYTMGITESVDTGDRCREYPYFVGFLHKLYSYVGAERSAPLANVVRAFLLDCGTKKEQIDKILDIIKNRGGESNETV